MENIANITEALSTFFRYTITETRNLVSLREELDNVKNYFVIQQYRFGDKLSIAVNIVDEAASILNLQCPKLFLQPIVENAVFHGLERKSENGLVSIRVEIIDQEVHIDISDNGVGDAGRDIIQTKRRTQPGFGRSNCGKQKRRHRAEKCLPPN